MDYSQSGLKRLADNDPAASFAAATRQHANAIQAGSHKFTSLPANSTVTLAVTFPTAYLAPPVVVVGLGYIPTTPIPVVWAFGISETGFSLAARSSAALASAVTQWVAVGKSTEIGG